MYKKKYLYIDESGDPNFFASGKKLLIGKTGYQPLLLIGMITTYNRVKLRKAVSDFMDSILSDPMYNTIPSIKDKNPWYLHAKDDHAEVRAKFFEYIRNLDGFKVYIIIGRKILDVFINKHNSNPTEFYFDMIKHLIKDRLNNPDEFYQIFLSQRGKNSMHRFDESIKKAIERDNIRRKIPLNINYQCDIVLSSNSPEMSIIDYLLWALQRYILTGESRFFQALIKKYTLIIDLYDLPNYKKNGGKGNFYTIRYPFDTDLAGKFEI
jgi:hypothetical protein